MSLKQSLFAPALRTEKITLSSGDEIVIKQITQAQFEKVQAVMSSDKSMGYKNAYVINARCTNPDGSAIFSDVDMSTFGDNVAVDNPLLVEVLNEITNFDKQTQEQHKARLGN